MEIHFAAKRGDREEVQRQLARGVSIDAREEEGKTPLMLAAESPDADAAFLDFLLGHGADLAVRDRWDWTPWLHAVGSGDIGKARLLKERGADIHAVGRCGDTALVYAAEGGDAPMTEWLLSLGFDVNSADDHGYTALHAAARCSAVSVIPILLAAGADIFAANFVQTQPIDEATTIETVRLLVEAGADINYVNGQGYWLLKSAAEAGDTEFAHALLASGAAVDTTNFGETALHSAVSANALDIMRLLLAAGANPNAQGEDGWGTLWYVRSVEAVEILLQAGVDVHLTNDFGEESLAWQTDMNIQKRLIAAGCFMNPPQGSPLMEAVERGDVSQIRFLLEAGAIVDTPTGWGQTPLMEAAENSFTDGVRLLLSAGADVSRQDHLSAGGFAALQDRGGRTALHHAAAPEAFTAYALALEHNTPEFRAKLAETLPESMRQFVQEQPVDLEKYGYVESDSVECLKLLTDAGADIDATDAAGFTPLLLAAACGRVSRIAGLLALGADVRRRTKDSKSVRELAEAHPREDQRKLILEVLAANGAA